MSILAGDNASADEKQRACAEIWRRFFPIMLQCAIGEVQGEDGKKVEALDAVQEAFAHLLRSGIAAQFATGRPLQPWLLRMVRNKARDLLRRERRQRPRNEPLTVSPETPSLLDELAGDEEFTAVMAQLTPDEQLLCRSVYIDGQSAKTVAADLGRDPQAVYRELHRIRTKIRSFLYNQPPAAGRQR